MTTFLSTFSSFSGAQAATGLPGVHALWAEDEERVHWDEPFARAGGSGGGYDIGMQRISWLAHLMTNWIGDESFLKRLKVQLRRPNWRETPCE